MDRFGVIVLNGYGQAEIGEVIGWTAEDARTYPEKLGAAGRPHPGVDVKVVDEEGRPLGPGVTGQLLVRPPRMAAGYAGGDSLDDRIDDDGYVRTGDYATVDEDGFVWIEGRTSDLIIRGGNKVFPDQVEEVLLLLPGIREAAVAGVPDDRLGEVPVAFVVGDATDDELRRYAARTSSPTRSRSPSNGSTPSPAARSARCNAGSSPRAGIDQRLPEGGPPVSPPALPGGLT